jgi:threonine dehydrogenase-like Zn-dependent dehydrogenase
VKAVWFADGAVEVRDVPDPAPDSGDALVRVTRAGICGTDLALLEGYADFSGIPGHEFVGVVEQCPNEPDWEGRRVTAEINVGCGRCSWCERGVREHCEARAVVGLRGRPGAFASHVTVPVANLHPIPDGLEDDQAVFAEPMAAAFEILEQINIEPATRVAVVGDGKLGLVITMVLSFAGHRPTVFGRHSGKLELASHFGGLQPGDSGNDAFDVVIEATGRSSGIADALRRVRPRGTVVLKTTLPQSVDVDLTRVVVDEIRLVGSRCGPFPRALEALGSGRLEPKVLVEGVYPLSRAVDAFEHARSPGALKVLLDPSR